MRPKHIATLAIFGITLFEDVGPALSAGALTPIQIVKQSQKAYDSVSTLDETVQSTMNASIGATAHIQFQRPGKLRVTGTTLWVPGSPSYLSKYDLLSNGTTWVSATGAWQKEPSAQMGIAAITGISDLSGTIVPAALLHTAWGSLKYIVNASATVANDTVNGRAVYKITTTTPHPGILWIDRKTFFIVKMQQDLSAKYVDVLTFGKPRINAVIPARAFVK